MTEKQRKAFENLGFSPEEMEEVLATDKEIDRGAKLFELPEELKAGAKKARQAERKPNATPTKREKKVNNDKLFLMETIKNALADCDHLELTNPEREMIFHFNGVKYKLTLACPRS